MTGASSLQGLYLHGFASGPQSTKAEYLCERLTALGIEVQRPDLNQGDFYNLTLTRQIQQCETLLSSASRWVVIGSSLGGLTAAWLGQRNPQVKKLALLAPAFNFLDHWQEQLGSEALLQWRTSGSTEVYHYAAQRSLPLNYRFWEDAGQYDEAELTRAVPTLIFHGTADETIPITASRTYIAQREWCKLVELDSDHALADVLPTIWDKTSQFLLESESIL